MEKYMNAVNLNDLTYDELKAAYASLLAQLQALQQENERLRAQLSCFTQESQPIATQTVLSLNERVELFRRLFHGRDDVFARRWYSVTTKKSGYQPVCANDRNYTLCNKKKYKCAECPHRMFAALTYRDLYNHLVGQNAHGCDVIGIYPMLPDNTCYFLCVDFDDKSCEHGYKDDVSAFVRVCRDWATVCAVERSRSGNGAHVWIFFSHPVPAAKARKLGYTLLSEAMNRSGLISFKSFDRFFPNQDYLPDGGFGNLVALPLQGLARKYGNSVFVDDSYQMYPDQWAYLQSLHRMSETEIDDILRTHHVPLELSTTNEETPWKQPRIETCQPHTLPQRIQIRKSNQLYIPYANLTPGAVNYFRRLSSFRNPEFYARQAMRLPTFSTPRIITCSEMVTNQDTGAKEMSLPRGCEETVMEFFQQNNVEVLIADKTNRGQDIDVSFNGELRPEQIAAIDQLSIHDTGVLSATTAFGKTVAAIGLIAKLKVNTLILVHTQALQTQWIERLHEFLHLEYTHIEEPRKRGRKKKISPFGTTGALHGWVDVVTIQSCTSQEEAPELLHQYGMVIVDECHHVSAVSFEQVLKSVTAKRVYGLTATPYAKTVCIPLSSCSVETFVIKPMLPRNDYRNPSIVISSRALHPIEI